MVISLLSLIMMAGCNMPKQSQFKNVDPEGWDAAMCLDYTLKGDSIEPAALYDLMLHIRYKETDVDSLIHLTIDRQISFDSVVTQNLQIRLIDKRYGPLGRGMHGLYMMTYPLASDISLPSDCEITIMPQQGLPEIKGVLSVGLSLSKNK